MTSLRIGLIGSGYMGKTYAECIKTYCKNGKVRMIQLRTLFEWCPIAGTTDGDHKHWTEDPTEGGLILDQGAHNFDFFRWFAGAEARWVFGRVTQFAPGKYPFPTAMAEV